MGNFNWRGAAAGLLGEAGYQMQEKARRLDKIEEQKLLLQRRERNEKANMLKEAALQKYGYDINGKPWTRGEYEALPENQRPQLYEKGLERPSEEKDDEPIGYDVNGGPVYKKDYKPGMALYKNQKGREVVKPEKDPFEGKIYWRTDTNTPIKQEEYWKLPENQRPPVTDKSPHKAKPEVTERGAREGILKIDEKIAKLRAEDSLSDEELDDLIEISPLAAAFLGEENKMKPEDRKKLIQDLERHKRWLQQFIPDNQSRNQGTLEMFSAGRDWVVDKLEQYNQWKSQQSGGILNPNENPDEISQFIDRALK